MYIVVTGPESSGKTSLSKDICRHFEIPYLEEYARTYLDKYGPYYSYSDLLTIAKSYTKQLHDRIQKSELIIADTDLLTIKIWSQYKYNRCDKWIVHSLENNKPDLYLLCSPEIPWEEDPLRENPNDRAELYQIYLQEIQTLDVPYIIVKGNRSKREAQAIKAVDNLKSQP